MSITGKQSFCSRQQANTSPDGLQIGQYLESLRGRHVETVLSSGCDGMDQPSVSQNLRVTEEDVEAPC